MKRKGSITFNYAAETKKKADELRECLRTLDKEDRTVVRRLIKELEAVAVKEGNKPRKRNQP